jgi:hypothetical protein
VSYTADLDADKPVEVIASRLVHLSHRAVAARRTEGAQLAHRDWPERKTTAAVCADAHGFSLRAAMRCGAHQRQVMARPSGFVAVAIERNKIRGLTVAAAATP